MKKKSHTFKITVTFDKKCTISHALQEVRDCIHGEFYPTQREIDEPGTFRVRSFRRIQTVRRS
jgi:hypothetical protein